MEPAHILTYLYPQFFLQCTLGKEALCRLSVAAECVFYFFFPFQCPSFVRLNQKAEAGRAWL